MHRSDSTSSTTSSVISTRSVLEIHVEDTDETQEKPQSAPSSPVAKKKAFGHRRASSLTPPEKPLEKVFEEPSLTPPLESSLDKRHSKSATNLTTSTLREDEPDSGAKQTVASKRKGRPGRAGNDRKSNFKRGDLTRTTSKQLGRYSKSSTALQSEPIFEIPKLTSSAHHTLHETVFNGINSLDRCLIHVGDYTPEDVLTQFIPAFKDAKVKKMEASFLGHEALQQAWKDFRRDSKAYMERGTVLPHEKELRKKSKEYLKEQRKHSRTSDSQSHLHDFVVSHQKLLTSPTLSPLAKPVVRHFNKSLSETLRTDRERADQASSRRDESYISYSEEALQNKRFDFSYKKLYDLLKTYGMDEREAFTNETADQSACDQLLSVHTTIKTWASQLALYRDGVTLKKK